MNILKFIGSWFLILLSISCNKNPDNAAALVKSLPQDTIAKPIKFNAENFPVYSVYTIAIDEEKKRLFISLSDRYLSTDIMPAYLLNNQKKVPFTKLKRINLPSSYRQKMLKETGIKENDSLYLFNYKDGSLEKYPVNKLNAVAHLNFYTGEGDEVSENSYMLGLEPIANLDNQNAVEDTYTTLAYFGSENIFADEALTPVKWTKISTAGLPGGKMKGDSLRLKEAFRFEFQDLVYYTEDFTYEEEVAERQFIVKNKTGKLLYNRIYKFDFEGASPTPLDGGQEIEKETYQWTGLLFKNQAPVIFDMVYYSFGCPEITFLDDSYEPFFINCDNRH